MNGLLKREQFDVECQQIMGMSKTLQDNFKLYKYEYDATQQYLVKTTTKVVKEFVSDELSFDLEENEEELCPENSNETTLSDHSGSTTLNFDHHILYSDSYNVPVMYFMASSQDGKMISLEEIWNLVPVNHQNALKEKWSFITQQEHPYLQRPFYQLHPCHTSSFMKALCVNNLRPAQYLLLWLSAVGPVVHFELHLDYYKP